MYLSQSFAAWFSFCRWFAIMLLFFFVPSSCESTRSQDHGSDFKAAMKSLYSLVSADDKIAQDFWLGCIVSQGSDTLSTGTDDAKVCSATVLEALAKVLSARAREQVANKFQEVKHFSYSSVTTSVPTQCWNESQESAATSRSPNQGQRSAETCCCNPAWASNQQQLELLKQLIPQYQEKMRNLEGTIEILFFFF